MEANRAPGYRRILVTRLRFMGDIVLTTPILRSIRHACPEARISFLGDRTAVRLLEHHPCVDQILQYDFTRADVCEQIRVVRMIRRHRFDLVLDLFGNPRSALLTLLSGAPVRVGPDRKGRGRAYTNRVHDDGKTRTAVEYHNQALRAAGIEPTATRTEIVLTKSERDAGHARLALTLGITSERLASTPVVGIHPGASWPAKKWLPDRYATLADRLRNEAGAAVVFTAGPNDKDAVAAVQSFLPHPIPVFSSLPLRDLASVIASCTVYVSNDAGPMHIAPAVGTPTVGIFGPGEEQIWFPYGHGDGHRALRNDVPCHPCHLDFCNRPGEGYMECMKLLTVDEVLGVVVRRIERFRGTVPH